MKKLLKKGLCLVLAMALMLAMGVPALAATEKETEPAPAAESSDWACKHQSTGTERNEAGYEICPGGCRPRYNVRIYCTYCGITLEQKTEYGSAVGHIQGPLSSATCDGRNQTWNYKCSRGCGYVVLSETRACYGAPHRAGSCQWLPL